MMSSFQLMTTEVTQGMWEEVMGSNPSYFSGNPSNPVECVSWNDSQEFISRLNDLNDGYTYRLPTEAEWEYAARAGTTTRFYWGDDPEETQIGNYAWYTGNTGGYPDGSTQPVGTKLPNAWGLYDMSGNVWEWVQDWYHSDYNGAPDDGSAWEYPEAEGRVARGGGWYYFARYCRSARRSGGSPGIRSNNLGFRVARSVR